MSGDARPLPPGWSAHRDERTGSMFYVNHSSQPATMSYAHPLDSAPQAAAVQQHAQAAAPPPLQVAHSIEYAARPASRASPQPSVSSGRSGSTGADRAQPPGTTGVRELHTVATPPVPLPPRSPPPPMHSRSVSMSMAYAPPQQLQYVPPPPPPRLASNPHRTSTYTPRLPNVQVQQPVQQQQQQQQPSRVTALYAAQAGVQPSGKTGRWSSFFGTPKSQPFQQQIIPLQQSATRPPPATIYQQQQRRPILTQPFQQQQQFVPQQQHQFVPQQQQQQQFVPQQQQLAPQQQQFVPQQQFGGQQQQQQVQHAQTAQQFVAPQQQQQQQLLVSQQMQPLPPLPQQLAIPQQQQVSQPLQQHPVVPQQQQAAVQQNIAPSTALDPQVLLQLSALLAQQQGVDQAQILQQLLVAQQQLQPVAQTQQVGPSPPPQSAVVSHQTTHGGIPVTAPQPVHPIPAQLSLGPSPSPSPQSPQAALAQYAPGLGLYTSQQASPPAAVGSPPAALQQSVTASPALSASGVSSFDATFPVDMNPSSTSPEDAAVSPDAQEPQYEQNLSTPAEMEPLPVIQPESVAHAEPLPAMSDAAHIVPGEAEENGADSPGPLPAYSLEPPNSAPPMADSFVADATLQEMAQAAESVVEATANPDDTLAAQPPQEFEVPAQTESSHSPVSPTQYTPGGRTVRPALPPRPSGPRSDRRLAGHAVSSHVNGGTHHSSASHAHGPGVASHVSPPPSAAHPAPSAGLHQNSVSATPAHAASPPPAHAASPSPSISPPNGVHAQSHSPAQGTPAPQYAAYQPAAGVPPVAQTPHAQYHPAQQQQHQSPVYAQQQQQQSPIYAQQQQQQAQHQHQQQQQPQQQYQQQQQQQQSASTSPPAPPPKPYAVYPDPGKQQSIGGRLSSFMSSPTTQAIAAKGAGLLGNLFVRTAVNAVTDSDSGSNYGYLNTGPSATDIAAGLAGNVVQNAIQQSIAPSPQPGLAGTAGLMGNATQGLAGTHTQAQLIQAQIQAQAQANTNALLQSMQGSQQAQTAAALLQAQKIQAANAQAALQAQQQQQQQNVQAQLAALLKMQQQQQSAQQAQQQAVLQQVQQQQAAQQAQQQAALQDAQQQAALQQAQQQALLQQVQQQQAAQQAQQQAMLEQVQQQQEAQQQAAFEQLQQQTAMYQSQQQAALEQMQAQNVFTPQIFASTNYEQPNGSGMDTLAQTIAQAMPQQSSAADPYSQAFSPDGGMAQAQIQGTSPDFLGALSQAIMGGAQTASYDPAAFLGAQQPGADASAMQAMTDALSQMQLGSQQMMSGGYDGSQQQTDYSQYLSSFGANDIIDSAVTNSV